MFPKRLASSDSLPPSIVDPGDIGGMFDFTDPTKMLTGAGAKPNPGDNVETVFSLNGEYYLDITGGAAVYNIDPVYGAYLTGPVALNANLRDTLTGSLINQSSNNGYSLFLSGRIISVAGSVMSRHAYACGQVNDIAFKPALTDAVLTHFPGDAITFPLTANSLWCLGQKNNGATATGYFNDGELPAFALPQTASSGDVGLFFHTSFQYKTFLGVCKNITRAQVSEFYKWSAEK